MPNDAQKAALQSQFTDSLLESLCTGANPPAFKSMDEQKEAWKGKFPTADPNAIDLMAKLMCFDPTERITAKEGLTHPYCVQFHDAVRVRGYQGHCVGTPSYHLRVPSIALGCLIDLI